MATLAIILAIGALLCIVAAVNQAPQERDGMILIQYVFSGGVRASLPPEIITLDPGAAQESEGAQDAA